MKSVAMKLPILLFTVLYAAPQQQPLGVSLGDLGSDVYLQLGMTRQEAVKKLSSCCRVASLGETGAIVAAKDDINHGLGMLRFESGKITSIQADRDWSPDPSSYETALALYRLVDEITTSGHSHTAVISTINREATNGNSKYLAITFQGGRSIVIEITTVDPSQQKPVSGSVLVSECVGPC